MSKLLSLVLFSLFLSPSTFAANGPIETIKVTEKQSAVADYFVDFVLHCPEAKKYAELTTFDHAIITIDEQVKQTVTTITADGYVVVGGDEGVGTLKIKIVRTQINGRFASGPVTYVATVDTSQLIPGIWPTDQVKRSLSAPVQNP